MRWFGPPRAGPRALLARVILLLGSGLLPACASSARPPAADSAEIRQQGAPRPHPHATWVEGHPAYREGRYVWVRGHWRRR